MTVELTGLIKKLSENLKTFKLGDLKGEKVDDTTLAGRDMKQQEKIISNLKSEIENKEKQLSLVLRKPVFGVSDQVRHKPGCTAAEDG